MLEWGGSEKLDVEAEVSSEREASYREMEKHAKAESKVMLQHFQSLLVHKGIDVTAVLVQFEEPLSRKNIATHVLQTAREREYGTIVVGRHIFSHWESIFRHQVGERLVETGEGLAIWVVG